MRPWSRRRPAGLPQVPNPPMAHVAPTEPVVIRLAVDRTVLDDPWGIANPLFANVWLDALTAGGWAGIQWPIDARTRRAIAPIDLQLGHVLEVGNPTSAWRCYVWVADVDPYRFVVAPAVDAASASVVAHQALATWRVTELELVEEAWRKRINQLLRP